jgi:ferredoxin
MLKRLKQQFTQQPAPAPILPPDSGGLMQVAADASRCVQCGLCGYNCPVGIDVRAYARRGENVTDPRCISCGACVAHCPRGTLRWGPAILVRHDHTLEIDPNEFVLPLRQFREQLASRPTPAPQPATS